jgi:hypothetical protein
LLTASLPAISCAGNRTAPEDRLSPPSSAPANVPADPSHAPDAIGADEATATGENGADPPAAAPTAPSASAEPTAELPGGGDGGDGSVVIIEAAPAGSPTPDLVAAAQAERDRRRSAPPSSVTITDKSLPRYATGELTYVEPTAAGEAGAAEAAPEVPGPTEEAYWREHVRDLRLDWREVAERVRELEAKAAQLRRDFYAADDGYYRDSRIKPAWDRALADLEAAKAGVEEAQEALAAALEKGRQAGALPGWLREGIEVEPRVPDPEPPPTDPQEPEVVEVDEPDGGGGR